MWQWVALAILHAPGTARAAAASLVHHQLRSLLFQRKRWRPNNTSIYEVPGPRDRYQDGHSSAENRDPYVAIPAAGVSSGDNVVQAGQQQTRRTGLAIFGRRRNTESYRFQIRQRKLTPLIRSNFEIVSPTRDFVRKAGCRNWRFTESRRLIGSRYCHLPERLSLRWPARPRAQTCTCALLRSWSEVRRFARETYLTGLFTNNGSIEQGTGPSEVALICCALTTRR